MKKINILKCSRDYDRIIKNNNSFKYKDYIIYIEKNQNQKYYKFGISVGKKIGNAVVRNKIKRQIKDIIQKKDYQNSFNCIIIVGRGIKDKNFLEMSKNLYFIFDKLKILKENANEE